MAAKPGDGGYSSEALLKSQLVVLGDRFSPDEKQAPRIPTARTACKRTPAALHKLT
jgi:hypothetical protein